jgi:hypothetical protein
VPELKAVHNVFIDGLVESFCSHRCSCWLGIWPTSHYRQDEEHPWARWRLGAQGRAGCICRVFVWMFETGAIVHSRISERGLKRRLDAFYNGFIQLKAEGFSVDAVAPQAALYLTVKIDLRGKYTESGKLLETTSDVTQYVLDKAGVAIVPFYAFGASKDSSWYRLSVGTCKTDSIPEVFESLRSAFSQLR